MMKAKREQELEEENRRLKKKITDLETEKNIEIENTARKFRRLEKGQ